MNKSSIKSDVKICGWLSNKNPNPFGLLAPPEGEKFGNSNLEKFGSGNDTKDGILGLPFKDEKSNTLLRSGK